MSLRTIPSRGLAPELYWIYANSFTEIFLEFNEDRILDVNKFITLKQVLSYSPGIADLPT